jgi:predicted HicB family RNase H-like nuclease
MASISINPDLYTYRVTWSPDDAEHVGLCTEFPSLSWLAKTPTAALKGIRQCVTEVLADMANAQEPIPEPLSTRSYSGEFRVRVPEMTHRTLSMQAAEMGISMNRLVSAKLAAS